jgi:hypothetical protein
MRPRLTACFFAEKTHDICYTDGYNVDTPYGEVSIYEIVL